jgi:hypothetical protein
MNAFLSWSEKFSWLAIQKLFCCLWILVASAKSVQKKGGSVETRGQHDRRLKQWRLMFSQL